MHPAGGNVYFRCEDTVIVQSSGTDQRQHAPEKSVKLVDFTLSERLAKRVLSVCAYTTFIKDCLSGDVYDDIDVLEVGLSPRTTSKREGMTVGNVGRKHGGSGCSAMCGATLGPIATIPQEKTRSAPPP